MSKTVTNFNLQTITRVKESLESFLRVAWGVSGWTKNITPVVHRHWELHSSHSSQSSYGGADPESELKKLLCLNLLSTSPVFLHGRQPFQVYFILEKFSTLPVVCPRNKNYLCLSLKGVSLGFFCGVGFGLVNISYKSFVIRKTPIFKKLGDCEVWTSFEICVCFCVRKILSKH